jgi:sRNA-binding regulator protein Hfq
MVNNVCSTAFLTEHKERKTVLKMFLISGTMLTGTINGFDDESVMIGKCLAFKRQITSITPKE